MLALNIFVSAAICGLLSIAQARSLSKRQTSQFSCGFEDANNRFCDLKQLASGTAGDNFDWTANTGKTPSDPTGPDAAVEGQWYAYIETSNPRKRGDKAGLALPEVLPGSYCLYFAYNMFGHHINELEVGILEAGKDQLSTQWQEQKNQGKPWKFASVELKLTSGDQVVFIGHAGSEYTGDIAIDDIRLIPGQCESSPPPKPTSTVPPTTKQSSTTKDSQSTTTQSQQTTSEASTSEPSTSKSISSSTTMQPSTTPAVTNATTTMSSTTTTTTATTQSTATVGVTNATSTTSTTKQPSTTKTTMKTTTDDDSKETTDDDSSEEEEGNVIVKCGFENNSLCGMEQSPQDEFNFTITSGQTPSSDTGPSEAYEGRMYIFIEASNPRKPGDRAILNLPKTTLGGSHCIKFRYSMYGQHVESLEVAVRNTSSGDKATLWSKQKNQGKGWLYAEFEEKLPVGSQVQFIATRGDEYAGDIALDDILFHEGTCNGTIIPDSTTSLPSTTTKESPSSSTTTSMPSTTTKSTTNTTNMPNTTTESSTTTTKRPTTTSQSTTTTTTSQANTTTSQPTTTTSQPTTTTSQPTNTTTQSMITNATSAVMTTTTTTITTTTKDDGTEFEVQCGFENDLCGMSQSNLDDFDFIIYSGRTPSDETGPLAAFEGQKYLYAEASSPRKQGDKAILDLPKKQMGAQCLSFAYHMYGWHIDCLTVEGTNVASSKKTELWKMCKDQGNMWLTAKLDVPGAMKVSFVATRGEEYSGDIALDNVILKMGACNGTANPTLSPTSTMVPTKSTKPSAPTSTTKQPTTMSSTTKSTTTTSMPTTETKISTTPSTTSTTTLKTTETKKPTTPSTTTTTTTTTMETTPSSTPTTMETTPSSTTTTMETATRSDATTTTTMKQTTTTMPSGDLIFSESFEGSQGVPSIGSMEHGNGDFQFSVLSGGTPSDPTGPSFAHTGRAYAYIEATGVKSNFRAMLNFPSKITAGTYCVHFAYHMFGHHIGDLALVSGKENAETTIWKKSGDQGNIWYEASVTAEPASGDKIGFIATRGDGYTGDIAIDSVNVTLGQCGSGSDGTMTPSTTTATKVPSTKTPTTTDPSEPVFPENTLMWSCNFESANSQICNMVQATNSNFKWSVGEGSTPTLNSGPSSAFEGNSYLFVEASNVQQGDQATIRVPVLGTVGKYCIEFMRHMYGSNIGTLEVGVYHWPIFEAYNPFWTQSGDQGDKWEKVQVMVETFSAIDQIVFSASRGNGAQGDIAIDAITITTGACQIDIDGQP